MLVSKSVCTKLHSAVPRYDSMEDAWKLLSVTGDVLLASWGKRHNTDAGQRMPSCRHMIHHAGQSARYIVTHLRSRLDIQTIDQGCSHELGLTVSIHSV